MVQDLLDLAQVKAGKFSLNMESFNLQELLSQLITLMGIQAEQKGIVLQEQFDPQIPIQVYNDPNRLRQIIINLVGNSLKFTKKGSISIKATFINVRAIRIRIIDTGIGIKDEDKGKLFQAFGKLGGQDQNQLNPNGVGLGLMISHVLAQNLGDGEGLKVESTFGQGTEFFFDISNNTHLMKWDKSFIFKSHIAKSQYQKKSQVSQNMLREQSILQSIVTEQTDRQQQKINNIQIMTEKSQDLQIETFGNLDYKYDKNNRLKKQDEMISDGYQQGENKEQIPKTEGFICGQTQPKQKKSMQLSLNVFSSSPQEKNTRKQRSCSKLEVSTKGLAGQSLSALDTLSPKKQSNSPSIRNTIKVIQEEEEEDENNGDDSALPHQLLNHNSTSFNETQVIEKDLQQNQKTQLEKSKKNKKVQKTKQTDQEKQKQDPNTDESDISDTNMDSKTNQTNLKIKLDNKLNLENNKSNQKQIGPHTKLQPCFVETIIENEGINSEGNLTIYVPLQRNKINDSIDTDKHQSDQESHLQVKKIQDISDLLKTIPSNHVTSNVIQNFGAEKKLNNIEDLHDSTSSDDDSEQSQEDTNTKSNSKNNRSNQNSDPSTSGQQRISKEGNDESQQNSQQSKNDEINNNKAKKQRTAKKYKTKIKRSNSQVEFFECSHRSVSQSFSVSTQQELEILTIDDNYFNNMVLKMHIERLVKVKVQTSLDGYDALVKLQEHYNKTKGGFALIFLDLSMPEMDGYETFTQIQKYCQEKQIIQNIVACTGYSDSEEKDKCFEIGMVDYIIKPIEISKLKEVLQLFLDQNLNEN